MAFLLLCRQETQKICTFVVPKLFIKTDPEAVFCFHIFTGKLRLTGVITKGPEDLIPLGSHHTVEVKLNTPITIKKEKWANWALKRLNQAIEASKKLAAIIVLLEDDTATLGLMRQFGIEYYGPIKGSVSGKRIVDKNRSKAIAQFYEKVIESVNKFHDIQNIVVAGPGFVKNDFYDDGKQAAISIASTMDMGIARDLFNNIIDEIISSTSTTKDIDDINRKIKKYDLSINDIELIEHINNNSVGSNGNSVGSNGNNSNNINNINNIINNNNELNNVEILFKKLIKVE